MLIHTCRRCGFQSKVFQEWANHLWGLQHQTVSRSSFLKWSDDENLKSLVIYAPAPPYPLPSDVLTLFQSQSITVVDFVCWADRPQNFVIQFQLKEDVDRVLKTMRQKPSELAFGGNTLGLRRKSDIEDFEWPGLIGDGTARNGSSETPVLIELSDDSNSNHSDDATANDSQSGSDTPNGTNIMNGNRHEESESMETDDIPSSSSASTHNGTNEAENGDDEVEVEPVELETKISDDFRNTFLDKLKSNQDKGKDDKNKVKANLKLLQSQWLDVYVGFHNKLWPLCFVMSNRNVRTNRNEVGFEAKFVCECLESKFNKWLGSKKEKIKDKVDAKIEEFLNVISSDAEAAERLTKIKESIIDDTTTLKFRFRCHIVVTFSVSGYATAKMKFSNIKGVNAEKKIKLVQKVFKKLFQKYEISEIDKWIPIGDSVKKEIKKEKQENSDWTEIEIITVD